MFHVGPHAHDVRSSFAKFRRRQNRVRDREPSSAGAVRGGFDNVRFDDVGGAAARANRETRLVRDPDVARSPGPRICFKSHVRRPPKRLKFVSRRRSRRLYPRLFHMSSILRAVNWNTLMQLNGRTRGRLERATSKRLIVFLPPAAPSPDGTHVRS